MTSPPVHPTVRLAVRDWDHLTPVFNGQLRAAGGPVLEVQARATTPDVLDEPGLDGGETSFSRYVRARGLGDDRLIGLPVFVMRGFRHRCVLVRRDSGHTAPEDLEGARVGLTGWPDSGNTWTRAVLREEGLDLGSVHWTVAPLTADEGAKDRVGALPLPANVRAAPPGETLVDALTDGRLDAVLTPFMPPGFFGRDSPLRHLYPDFRAAERAYFASTGFVPGIHLITLKRGVVERHPELPRLVLDTFELSKRHWLERRRMLADTAPWVLAELEETARTFDGDWMPYGTADNAAMTAAFCTELHAQGITPERVDPESVFADFERYGLAAAGATTRGGE